MRAMYEDLVVSVSVLAKHNIDSVWTNITANLAFLLEFLNGSSVSI